MLKVLVMTPPYAGSEASHSLGRDFIFEDWEFPNGVSSVIRHIRY